MTTDIIDFSKIDEIAMAGYLYASGKGRVPKIIDQLDIDAFNAGIENYNMRNGTHVLPLSEGMKSTYHEVSRKADKELAIIGPW